MAFIHAVCAQDEEQHSSLPLAPLILWPDAARWAAGGDDLNAEQKLRRVQQAVLRAGVEPALQSPMQRSSYPQLRVSARYRPLPDELVHLFGFSEATGRNDAGSLDANENLQIARQLPASSINRSRWPSPLLALLLRHAPHTFSFVEFFGLRFVRTALLILQLTLLFVEAVYTFFDSSI